jgi:Protein of unknown function (DUF3240)
MNASIDGQVLAAITCSPALESQLIDWLLLQEGGAGFSSVQVHGHSTRHEHLSIAEQVSGRQRRLQFQIQLDAARLDEFLGGLKSEFAGADIHYWAVPILAGGHLG